MGKNLGRGAAWLALCGLSGCSGASRDSVADSGSNFGDDTGTTAPSDTASADDTGTPPEQEDDLLRLTPASTPEYVFIANPDRDSLTRISVPSLAVLTIPVGAAPTVVAAGTDGRYAVTLNEGSDDVSVVDAATMAEVRVPIRDDMNRLVISPDGEWCVAWYDPAVDSSGTSDGIYSFNEVSFVHLPTATHHPMAVGFSPGSVRWTPDGLRAVVVSDGSLAVVELSILPLAPHIVALADDPMEAPLAEEVEIAPDGLRAFVRQRGLDAVAVVDLGALTLERVTVGADPSDMDISPDGMLAVVSRGEGSIWLIDPADPQAAARIIPLPEGLPAGDAYGSIQFIAGDRAVLYTTATRLSRFALWDRATDAVQERPLVKPVQTLSLSADGNAMLVFHTLDDSPDDPTDSPFRGEWAVTQVNLTDLRSNPLLLPAEPQGYTVSEDGRYGFFILKDLPFLESLSFSTLLNTELSLPSIPRYVGVLPGTATAWASQVYDLGRVSFYDADTGSLDTITGFELNADIEH